MIRNPHLDARDAISRWQWAHQMAWALATRGDAMAVVSRNGKGTVTSTMPVNPDDVAVRLGRTGREYQIRQIGQDWMPASEVIHIPLHLEPGALRGLSPIGLHKRGLGLAMATETYGGNWFADGATPSSVLESDAEISTETAQENQARWIASHGGRRRPAVLSGG